MVVSVEAKIINGLLGHFRTLTLPSGASVAYPNVDFTPNGNAYVRLSIEKNIPSTVHIGGGSEPIRMGLFMASVCWPVGQGLVQASELAGAIRDRFAFNTKIDHDGIRIWITEEPAVRGDIQGSVYSEIPVVTPWKVFP